MTGSLLTARHNRPRPSPASEEDGHDRGQRADAIGKPCRIDSIMAVADTAEENHVGGAAAESIMTLAETFNQAVDNRARA